MVIVLNSLVNVKKIKIYNNNYYYVNIIPINKCKYINNSKKLFSTKLMLMLNYTNMHYKRNVSSADV